MKIHGTPPSETTKRIVVLEDLITHSHELMEAVETLKQESLDEANTADTFNRKRYAALRKHKDSGKSAEMREAYAFDDYADEQHAYETAKKLKEAQVERVRSLRQVLSALQTFVSSTKAEADAYKYGQSGQQ